MVRGQKSNSYRRVLPTAYPAAAGFSSRGVLGGIHTSKTRGAGKGTRTPTLEAQEPKSCVSTNFAIPA